MKVDALAWQKNSKRYFLKDIGNSYRSRTSPFFSLFEISQQIQSLEMSKVLDDMGRGWQAV